MMKYKHRLAFILFLPLTGIAQDMLEKFELINTDTIVTHHVSGEYNSPNFIRIDSTQIWADIILEHTPDTIDFVQLKTKVETIMKANHINKAFVFRDKESSQLFRFSSLYAAQLLQERKGYLGEFNLK